MKDGDDIAAEVKTGTTGRRPEVVAEMRTERTKSLFQPRESRVIH
jgi:hypothetical protein